MAQATKRRVVAKDPGEKLAHRRLTVLENRGSSMGRLLSYSQHFSSIFHRGESTSRLLAMVLLLFILSAGVVQAQSPAFWVYYYNYGSSISQCRALAREVLDNVDKNWNFSSKKFGSPSNWFSVGDTRGTVGCLDRGQGKSLITIIVTGNNSKDAKDLFDEVALGICGRCSSLAR